MVSIPSPLRSYADGACEVPADGSTLGEILLDLDRRHRAALPADDEQGQFCT
jgi:hypothetical protein